MGDVQVVKVHPSGQSPTLPVRVYLLRQYSGYLLLECVFVNSSSSLSLSLVSDITMLWAEGVECLSVYVSSPPARAGSQRLNRSNVSAAVVPVSITQLLRARAVHPGTHILSSGPPSWKGDLI